MGDCPSVDIRDALPDLMRDDIDAAMRARVEEHLATCADCTAELALLKRIRLAAAQPVAIDVDRIVRALPPHRIQRNWAQAPALRIAATFLVLAGAATWYAGNRASGPIAVLPGETAIVVSSPRSDSPAVRGAPERTLASAATPKPAATARGISLGGGLGDFSDVELQSLLAALDSFDAELGAEPDVLQPILDAESAR